MAEPEILPPDQAVSLFYNGHRLAKEGDPPSHWMAMNRTSGGESVLVTPMPPDMEQAIRDGRFYLAEGVPEGASAPAGPPTNVDIPHVSADDDEANCTMGNWENMQEEPHSYAYAWQRDGSPISGATLENYPFVAADTGKAIGCIVTATNSGGSTTAPISNTVVGP